MSGTSLWEINHPYYCSDSNYYSNDYTFEHDTWQSFIDEMGEADEDYNYLVRWDWKTPDPDDYEEIEDVPDESLHLYYVQQRKGNFAVFIVTSVSREQEPEIREWLKSKAQYVRKVWEPFLD